MFPKIIVAFRSWEEEGLKKPKKQRLKLRTKKSLFYK